MGASFAFAVGDEHRWRQEHGRRQGQMDEGRMFEREEI
jgi:hypothetical protein